MTSKPLTQDADHAVGSIAQRFGLSYDAVTALLHAVANGGGHMAQFYHHDLGGGGQWMRGGMTMVGDMFNDGLRSKVSSACGELADLLARGSVWQPAPETFNAPQGGSMFGSWQTADSWWPGDLGSPSSSGGQNDMRYAYFPSSQRLAISEGGAVSLYDTLDHRIGGVQQQQGGGSQSLTFTSQNGTFAVDSLPQVSGASGRSSEAPQPAPGHSSHLPTPVNTGPRKASSGGGSGDDHVQLLERLADLRTKGVLTEDEFQAKKAEVLKRL